MASGPSLGFLVSRNYGPECRGAFAASHFVRVHFIASQPCYVTDFSTNSHLSVGGGWALNSTDAAWTFNLRHHTSRTIPISAGLVKVWVSNQLPGENHERAPPPPFSTIALSATPSTTVESIDAWRKGLDGAQQGQAETQDYSKKAAPMKMAEPARGRHGRADDHARLCTGRR